MAGFWESVCDKANSAYEAVKNSPVTQDICNTLRMVNNNVKYAALAVAASTMNGTGELLKDGLKNIPINKVADWAKPIGECGKFLSKFSLPLKLLSAGEAIGEMWNDGRVKKACEFAGAWACGAGAATLVTVAVGATPVGWAAAGVFVAGSAAAWAGDYLGGKLGEWIDNRNHPPAEIIPPEPVVPVVPTAPATPLEEIRKAEPAIPLEFRKAIPAEIEQIKKAIIPGESSKTTIEYSPLASISPLQIRSNQAALSIAQV